jgi:hypothetical protein
VLEPGLAKEIDKIRDIVGSFYRYTLRKSLPYKLRAMRGV